MVITGHGSSALCRFAMGSTPSSHFGLASSVLMVCHVCPYVCAWFVRCRDIILGIEIEGKRNLGISDFSSIRVQVSWRRNAQMSCPQKTILCQYILPQYHILLIQLRYQYLHFRLNLLLFTAGQSNVWLIWERMGKRPLKTIYIYARHLLQHQVCSSPRCIYILTYSRQTTN